MMEYVSIPAELWEDMKELSYQEVGRSIMAVMELNATGNCDKPNGREVFFFNALRRNWERMSAKRERNAETYRQNGANGGRPPKQAVTQENQSGFEKTKAVSEETKKTKAVFDETKKTKAVQNKTKLNQIKQNESKPNENKPNEGVTPLQPPTGGGDRFARFWEAYPRKVGKGAAEKAFSKLHPTEELLTAMLRAIQAQKQSSQWQRDGGQYIPHPATWLNQLRWEDEPEPMQTVNGPRNLFAEYAAELQGGGTS